MAKFTVYENDNSFYFENNSTGEGFTIYCEVTKECAFDRITDVLVYEYDEISSLDSYMNDIISYFKSRHINVTFEF